VKPEADVGDDAEECQGGEASQIDRQNRRAARFQAPQEDREAGAEQERERAPGLLFDEHPHAPPDQVFQSAGVPAHLLMKMDQNHAEQRQAPKDIQRVQPLRGIDRCRRRRGDGHRCAHRNPSSRILF
jgi:hypothetical protein